MKERKFYLNLSKVTLISPATTSLRVQIRLHLTLAIIYLAPPLKTQLSVLSHWENVPIPVTGVTRYSHTFFPTRSLFIETFALQEKKAAALQWAFLLPILPRMHSVLDSSLFYIEGGKLYPNSLSPSYKEKTSSCQMPFRPYKESQASRHVWG